jgi:hypothetical protein
VTSRRAFLTGVGEAILPPLRPDVLSLKSISRHGARCKHPVPLADGSYAMIVYPSFYKQFKAEIEQLQADGQLIFPQEMIPSATLSTFEGVRFLEDAA